ncbi:3'-5' exonuclease [Pseudomonadota bacterium]
MAIDLNSTLTPSQMVISNAPIDHNYVIEGGPGTGKTLLALLRAKKILDIGKSNNRDSKSRVLFVVFNRPLMVYLKNQVRDSGLSNSTVSTYHSWLWHLFRSKGFDDGYPKIRPFEPNWVRVKEIMLEWHKEGVLGFDHSILDEAQDLPIELIDIIHSISGNITVFIDEEQNIDPQVNTSIDEVVNLVCDSSRCKFFLTDNHRNYKEIIDLALIFGRDGNMPNKSRKGAGRLPLLSIGQSEEDYISTICTYRQENTDQIIGVFLHDNAMRDRYYDKLKNRGEKVQRYISNSEKFNKNIQNKFNLDSEGIKLLSVDVAKGLEFDAVFIPSIDNVFWSNTKQKRNLAMVSITRAEERLFLHAENDSRNTRSVFFESVLSHKNLVDIVYAQASSSSSKDSSQFNDDDFEFSDDDIPF